MQALAAILELLAFDQTQERTTGIQLPWIESWLKNEEKYFVIFFNAYFRRKTCIILNQDLEQSKSLLFETGGFFGWSEENVLARWKVNVPNTSFAHSWNLVVHLFASTHYLPLWMRLLYQAKCITSTYRKENFVMQAHNPSVLPVVV